MTTPNQAEYDADSATASLRLIGVAIDTAGAASVAAALNTQIGRAAPAFAALPFEAEPAAYLAVSAEEAP